MSQTVRIFVSSPSDVPAERKAVERVASRVAGQFRHIEIEVYRWESGHYFSAHTGFQEQIEEIGGFDLVVGILWSRLGSPLPPNFGATMPPPREGQPYPSGTAFEILEAIRWRTERGSETPDVLVYQKRATAPSAPPDDHVAHEDLDRQRKAIASFVQDFFSNPSEGIKGAFKPFDALSEFEGVFENDLLAWLRENRSLARQRNWRVEELGSPFRGLDAFDAAHREVFFGRRREIERARERLEGGSGFLLIDGASGTGKSSLARAGLIPRMQDLDPDLRVAVTRPETDNPLLALAQALFETGSLPELAAGDYTDATALGRHLAGGGDVTPILRALDRASQALTDREQRDSMANLSLVLLVDQCEALFTNRVSAEEQRAYGAALEALVTSGRVQVIATLRANAREAALTVPAFGRLIDGQQGLSLGWPTPDAFGEIVRGPAEAAGLRFERNDAGEGLDEVLLREVVHDPDVLPLLQFALDQLYDKAAQRVLYGDAKLGDVPEGEPVLTLTHADYKMLGGLSGAIGQQADAALRTVSDAAQVRLPSLVRALTVAGPGTTVLGRAPIAIAVPDAATQELVEALLDARILVRGVREDEATQDKIDELRFAHERVLSVWDKARDAVTAAQTFLRVRGDLQQAEARWREAKQPTDLLLPAGLRLAEAEDVLSEFGAELDRQDPRLRGYVQTSARFARRRQRITQAAAAIFALFALAAGWFAYQSYQNAEEADRQRDRAERELERASRSFASAVSLLPGLSADDYDYNTAVALALHGYALGVAANAPSETITQALSAISHYLPRLDRQVVTDIDYEASAGIDFNEVSNILAIGGLDGVVRFYRVMPDGKFEKLSEIETSSNLIYQLEQVGNADFLTKTNEGISRLSLTCNSGECVASKEEVLTFSGMPVFSFALSHDRREIIVYNSYSGQISYYTGAGVHLRDEMAPVTGFVGAVVGLEGGGVAVSEFSGSYAFRRGGETAWTLGRVDGSIIGLTSSRYASVFFLGGSDSLIVVDIDTGSTGKIVLTRNDRSAVPHGLLCESPNQLLISLGKLLYVYDRQELVVHSILEGHQMGPSAWCNSDMTQVFSASKDKTLRRWMIAPVQQLWSAETRQLSGAALLSADQLALFYLNGEVEVRDLTTGLSEISLPPTPTSRLENPFLPGGKFMLSQRPATASLQDGRVITADASRVILLERIDDVFERVDVDASIGDVRAISLQPGGNLALASSYDQIALLDFASRSVVQRYSHADFMRGRTDTLSFWDLTSSSNGFAILFRRFSGSNRASAIFFWSEPFDRLERIFFDNDISLIALTHDASALFFVEISKICRTALGQLDALKKCIDSPLASGPEIISLSPDGRVLAIGGRHGSVAFVDAASGFLLRNDRYFRETLNTIEWIDNTRLIAADSGRVISIELDALIPEFFGSEQSSILPYVCSQTQFDQLPNNFRGVDLSTTDDLCHDTDPTFRTDSPELWSVVQ